MNVFIAIFLKCHGYLAILWGKLDRIANKIHQYLSDLVSIRPNGHAGIRRRNFDPNELFCSQGPQVFCYFFGERGERKICRPNFDTSGLDPGEIEKFIDQPRETVGI